MCSKNIFEVKLISNLRGFNNRKGKGDEDPTERRVAELVGCVRRKGGLGCCVSLWKTGAHQDVKCARRREAVRTVSTVMEGCDMGPRLPPFVILDTAHTWAWCLWNSLWGDLLTSVFWHYVLLSDFVLPEDMKEPDDQDTDGERSRSDGKQSSRSNSKRM